VKNNDVRQDPLENLADVLTEDILNTPDDEVLREVEEDFGDRRALANRFDQIVERAEKQVFGTARPSPQVRSSGLDLLYRVWEWFLTLFGEFQLSSVNRMVWVGAATVLIVLILAPAVFRSMSEFKERSRQLAALEKEQLARSEQLVAQEKALLARSEQLAAREKESLVNAIPTQTPQEGSAPVFAPLAFQPEPIPEPIELSVLCKNELFEHLICADADLAFWPNLVSEIYQHRWRQLDTNGQQMLRQDQLDWLRNMRVDCNVPEAGTRNEAEMERAKSCVLQSTKKRVAVLSNN
jgi:uncharacterized protein YecT (DUF1311 family)/Na+-transporting methylmalonyl-CoA/oxaloacetate decarboxylase gamma subunit